jgi:hypothetical protein
MTSNRACVDREINEVDFTRLMENQVQDDQYDQRNAEKPTEKIRHDVTPFVS